MITVLYFAAVRDLVGTDEERIETDARSIHALASHLCKLHPSLEGRLEAVRFARNESFAEPSDPVEPGDTIALIPPVAGG